MRKLSAVIITKNEEHNIKRCLNSIKNFTDEIVIVDSGSTDRTLEICRSYSCKIISSEWLGFGKTKKLAVNSATNDWVLAIDADEEVTTELAGEIKSVLLKNDLLAGYRIEWLSYFIKGWIKHSGWNKQYKIKLFDRRKGNFNDSLVHEKVIINGEVGYLKNKLNHYTYLDMNSFISKMNHYTTDGAKMLGDKGERASFFGAYLHGAATFIKIYLLKMGFLDGKLGLVLAANYAFAAYLKYIKYWEMSTEKKEK